MTLLTTQAAAFVALDIITLARASFLLSKRKESMTRSDAGWGLVIDIVMICVAMPIGLVVLLFGGPGPECDFGECLNSYPPEPWLSLPSIMFFAIS